MTPRRKAKLQNGSLLHALKNDFDSFSKSHKAIARYLVDHFSEAPVLSAQDLARRTGTTRSTVVRFAQHLGFTGFPDMMKAAWDEHRLVLAANGPAEEQLHLPVEDDFSGRAVRMDIGILKQTLSRNLATEFFEIIAVLETSKEIYITGMFEAALVVSYLHYYLSIMGLPVTAVTDNSEKSVAALSGMSEESALIAVGFRTGHQFVTRIIKAAGDRRVATIGISDNQLSEVAKISERNLFCQLDSTSFAPSLIGGFSICNAIISALFARNRRAYEAHISQLRKLPLSSDWL